MKIPSLFRAFQFLAQSATPSRPPAVESLEDRIAPATIFLVPPTDPLDATHRYSLPDALNLAGASGTVIVEPGTTAQFTPVTVNLDGITIMGDPGVPLESLERYNLNIVANSVTLNHLKLGDVTVAGAGHNVTVTGSHLVNFTETGGANGIGNNTLRHNVILGAVDLQGNSDAGQPTGDAVEENTFIGNAAIQLKLTNSNLTTIKNNHFTNSGSSGVAIQVRSNSDGVTITGNTVEMTGPGVPFALVLINTGGAAGNLLSAKVLGNSLKAGPAGTGLLCNIFGTGAGFVAQVEGNDLNGNKIGIDINGIMGFATGAGAIDLGGGANALGTSKGGNNFRSFVGQAGTYAINLHNTDAGGAVSAQGNIFDNGVTADTVIRDQDNGGGTGMVDASNSLDANHAYVQSLCTQLLGRAADPAAGGELDLMVAKLVTKGRQAVAKAILMSNESLGRMVNSVYSEFLGRDVQTAELTKFATQLAAGKDITAVEAGVLGSIEYQTHIDTNFVQALYGDLLDRTATSAEVAKGYKTLQARGLKGLAATIAYSKERRVDAAMDCYRDLLHRDPTAAEASVFAKKPGLLKAKLKLLSGDDFFNHG